MADPSAKQRASFARGGRIDWKHLLGLESADPGFDASVPSEFRGRLVTGGAEALLLGTLLALCREQKLLVPHGRQRTDSTHVLGAVRSLNRPSGAAAGCFADGSPRGDGCAIETMQAALNALAVTAPDWLHLHADPASVDRYAKPADDDHIPLGEAARRACAEGSGVTAMRCSRPSRHRTRRPSCAGSGCRTSAWCRPRPFLAEMAPRPATL